MKTLQVTQASRQEMRCFVINARVQFTVWLLLEVKNSLVVFV